MLPALQQYLVDHSFVETSGSSKVQLGVGIRAYENGEFRVHVVNEPASEVYVQVAAVTRPEQRLFLSGIVAFLTGDDSATRSTGLHAQWLAEHHSALVELFSASPEGEAQRERYGAWQREFALREQGRLAAAAIAIRGGTKPWWKFW